MNGFNGRSEDVLLPPQPKYELLKRFLDITIGVVLLLLLAIPLLLIALAVYVSSPGGVFYRQKRVGRYNRIFELYKFRTMYDGADQNGPLCTAANDERITPLGRILRRTKLDELPQLINVVKGDMSLVGPRPQVPRFVEKFPPEQRELVLAVRPGITGPTQILFRNEEQLLEGIAERERYYIEELLPIKCQLDVTYVTQRSLRQDMKVLWDTAKVLLGASSTFDSRTLPTLAVTQRTFSNQEEAPDPNLVGWK